MTAIAYTVEQGPNGLIFIQSSGDTKSGTELEKRIAQWLDFAMSEAIKEFRSRMASGITFEKEGIAKLARAACKSAMEVDWPQN